jgi:glucose-1-phosphate thymidylyltransferase
VKAVVLAAGKGSRLFPITRHIPKPILPLCGKPTLAYAFEKLVEAGATEVALVVAPDFARIQEALRDGSDFGIDLSYWVQDTPQGLAHAVKSAKEFCGSDKFLLYLGDAVYDRPLKPYCDTFASSTASSLCLVKQVEDPRRFGVAELEGERIVRLEEKPQQPKSDWAMAGLYCFDHSIWEAIDLIEPSQRGEYEITDAIQWLIDQGQTVLAGRYTGRWFDTGTLTSYLETTRHLIQDHGKPEFTDLGIDIDETSFVHVGSSVKAQSVRGSVVLPESDVTVSGRIENSLIAGNVNWDGDLIGKVIYGDEAL